MSKLHLVAVVFSLTVSLGFSFAGIFHPVPANTSTLWLILGLQWLTIGYICKKGS